MQDLGSLLVFDGHIHFLVYYLKAHIVNLFLVVCDKLRTNVRRNQCMLNMNVRSTLNDVIV